MSFELRPSKMFQRVIVRIEGGLGNQLFQYAAARTLADRLQCELLLDLRGIEANGDRPYQLDMYRVRAEIATTDVLASLPSWRPTRARRIQQSLSFLLPKVFATPIFWPRSFAYDPRIELLQYPVYMVGYWQSERYFVSNRTRLLQDLVLQTTVDANEQWVQKITASNSVSLHVRRGDYVSNASASQFHGICDLAYYQKAVSDLVQREPDIEVFVFSDEPQWVAKNLRLPVPMYIVDANSPDSGHLDIELMRRCRHHVLANSSFSWWGAWLCERPGQIVFAPRRWFADADINSIDVVPERWFRVAVSP